MEDKVQSIDESAKSQDFFQDNKAIKTKYTTTIKSRNFLTNIAWRLFQQEIYFWCASSADKKSKSLFSW